MWTHYKGNPVNVHLVTFQPWVSNYFFVPFETPGGDYSPALFLSHLPLVYWTRSCSRRA